MPETAERLDEPSVFERQPGQSETAQALRHCALSLLDTARRRKEWGISTKEDIARLVKSARWHWHWYIRERGING